MLRSTVRMGRQLQKSLLPGCGSVQRNHCRQPENASCGRSGVKLASPTAPLRLPVIPGPEGSAGPRRVSLIAHAANRIWHELCLYSEDAVEKRAVWPRPGRQKGFFEQANGGSVLLDEIGEMSPRMQSQTAALPNDADLPSRRGGSRSSRGCGVICATQKNLVELVQKRMFREDLYYRLNVLTLNIPPLRGCPQDIIPLTELFVVHASPTSREYRVRNCQPIWVRC